MASLLSLNPYKKGFHSIELVHVKDGVVKFEGSAVEGISGVHLKLVGSSAPASLTSRILYQTVLKLKVGVFLEILWCGLKKNRAICLDGWTPVTDPKQQKPKCYHAVRTVIQMDGDIICKISKELLKEKNAAKFIELNAKVVSEFLKQFTRALALRVLLVRSIAAAMIGATIFLLW